VSFWAGKRLLNRLGREKLVDPFSQSRVKYAAYTLSLGAYAFTTADSAGESAERESAGVVELKERQQISIPPGQFAFLLTEEVVTVPNDAIAFISLKTRRKFEGLVNVSGFHVDPGWSSRLIFGVLNAGPSPIVLERGQPLFLLFFADLSAVPAEPLSVDTNHVYKEKDRYSNIPAELVQKMSGAVPSLYRLNSATAELNLGVREAQATARYARLVASFALGISVLIFGLLFKAVFFPTPPPTAAVIAPIHSPELTPPRCTSSGCVSVPKSGSANTATGSTRTGKPKPD